MKFDEIKKTLVEKFGDQILVKANSDKNLLHLNPQKWEEVALFLCSQEKILFDQLECLTGIDLGENHLLEVRYNLFSMNYRHKLEVRISTSRTDSSIPSVEKIWRMADWFEREAYDMYGIIFEGHRDLTRILCPEDWEGWPLRKDYNVQDTYHGIVVPKIKEGWE